MERKKLHMNLVYTLLSLIYFLLIYTDISILSLPSECSDVPWHDCKHWHSQHKLKHDLKSFVLHSKVRLKSVLFL